MPYVLNGYWVNGYAVGDEVVIAALAPGLACIADVSAIATIGDTACVAVLAETVNGSCSIADEGLVCP